MSHANAEPAASLDKRVRSFVSRRTNARLDRITPSTSLSWDIGLAGDDAHLFFQEFRKQFEIDPASLERLPIAKHFGTEGLSLGGYCVFSIFVAPGFVLGWLCGFPELVLLPFTVLSSIFLLFLF